MSHLKKDSVLLVSIICFTIVALSLIAAWIYTNDKNIAQRNRELFQAKQLKEYEQKQINERASKERQCQSARDSGSLIGASIGCQ